MGVKLRRARGKWYLYIDWNGKRKCKCVGTNKQFAEEIRRQVEAKLALGDLNILGSADPGAPHSKSMPSVGCRCTPN